MSKHGDRPRSRNWKPGSSMIPATARDIARQVERPLPHATDGAAKAIRDRLQDHQDILQSAQHAHDRDRPIVKRGRILGPADTALEVSTRVITSKDAVPYSGDIPLPPFRQLERATSSDLHFIGYDEHGIAEQKLIRYRKRPTEEGAQDILVITDKQNGTSSVVKYHQVEHPTGFDLDRSHISTTRDQEGNITATFFTEDGTRVSYLRDPRGNEFLV